MLTEVVRVARLALTCAAVTSNRPVPMEFEKLVNSQVDSPEVRQAINDLLERKKAGQELDRQPKIEALSHFIETELERLEKISIVERDKPNFDRLNVIFRKALI